MEHGGATHVMANVRPSHYLKSFVKIFFLIMKRVILYSLCIFIYSCNISKNKVEQEYQLSTDTVYFKSINLKDTLNKTIFFKNNSDKIIKLLSLKSSCGCTSLKLSDSLAKPNDSIAIQIRYIPLSSADSGKILKYITIRSNAKIPFKTFILKGEVIK